MQTSVANADEAAKAMKENMDASRKTFQTAADAIPGPLGQIGIQVVASLAQAATTTIAQSLPAMMGMMVGGPMGAMAGAAASGKQNGAQAGGRGKKGRTITQPAVCIPDVNDPGYKAALATKDSITLLATILGVGTKNGVDWESLTPTGTDSKHGLTFIDALLSHTLKNTEWTDGPASTELKETLENLEEVIAAVKTEVAKDKSLTAKKAGAENPLIKEWQDKASSGKAAVLKLSTTAASLPGSAPGGAPFVGKTPTASGGSESGATAALASAQEKLKITEAAYTSSQANYQKAVENRTKVEGELARIKANLKSMQLQKAQMEEIKQILIQCIGTLVQMKQQITNLVRFFSALSAMVEHVVKQNVRDFLDQAGTAKDCLIGNISLSDMTRQELYTATLMVQAYFSLFSSIATMYKKISVDHIMPGVKLCDELSRSTTDPNAITSRMNALDDFTDNAQRGVQAEVSKFQKATADSLEERVEAVQADTKLLPALPPSVQQAITDGKEKVTDQVSSGFDSHINAAVAADTGVSMDDL